MKYLEYAKLHRANSDRIRTVRSQGANHVILIRSLSTGTVLFVDCRRVLHVHGPRIPTKYVPSRCKSENDFRHMRLYRSVSVQRQLWGGLTPCCLGHGTSRVTKVHEDLTHHCRVTCVQRSPRHDYTTKRTHHAKEHKSMLITLYTNSSASGTISYSS